METCRQTGQVSKSGCGRWLQVLVPVTVARAREARNANHTKMRVAVALLWLLKDKLFALFTVLFEKQEAMLMGDPST